MQQAVAFGSSHALALRPTKVHTAPRVSMCCVCGALTSLSLYAFVPTLLPRDLPRRDGVCRPT